MSKKKEKFDMLLGSSGRYSESWIIYPTGGNYIYDEVCKLPGGSKILHEKALKVLNAMNGK